METITKELFIKYIKLQKSGQINMNDITRGSQILKCTKNQYITILHNYKALYQKYILKFEYRYHPLKTKQDIKILNTENE